MPKLFKTDIAAEANLKVFVTDIRSEADLVVFETTSQWDATSAQVWCYTDIQSDADKIVFFADSQWDADIIIYKTDIQSDAGWQNSGKSDLL
jgi:Tol biopolymer transport system component